MMSSMVKSVVCAIAILTSAFAASHTLVGDWKWAAESPAGTSEGTFHIERADTTYTGTGTQPSADGGTTVMTLQSARVRDDSVWMSANTVYGVTSVVGAFVNDSTIKGTWATGDQSGAFTMKRTH